MMPSSANIHRLPPEILLRIFSYLPPKDVAGLAKVNRCFSRLAPDACKRVAFFVLAAKAGKKAIVEHVIEGTTDDQRKTAFMLAAKNGHTEVLALLLPSIIEQNLATQQVATTTDSPQLNGASALASICLLESFIMATVPNTSNCFCDAAPPPPPPSHLISRSCTSLSAMQPWRARPRRSIFCWRRPTPAGVASWSWRPLWRAATARAWMRSSRLANHCPHGIRLRLA
jgi:hypothetical protein